MNYFEILKFPIDYDLSLDYLESQFQKLATLYHPDRVASLSAFEKKQYMQMFTTLNDAYQTLKNPISRAEYILSLNNIEYDSEKTFQYDPELLESQMLFREKIDDAQNLADLVPIVEEIETNLSSLFVDIASSISSKSWDKVTALIDKAKFFDKLLVATQQKQTLLEKE
ncbi:Fe-S protein assembly co-chaperone HscB [Neisseriaceae bacterium PsAf]|nr:Fe-S protein assembly co-chaperone HscB [Neisseriaceae bacterium PsAf]